MFDVFIGILAVIGAATVSMILTYLIAYALGIVRGITVRLYH
jgi:hypothetical protein